MEWTKKKYNDSYNSWVPWVEDKYLAWFGENKTSYTAKAELSKTKITGNENVDKIQDGLNNEVGGQFAKGGLAGGVGKLMSDEGMTRAERGDTGPVPAEDMQKGGKTWGQTLTGGYLGGDQKK